MKSNIKTFNEIGTMAFAGEENENNALVLLTTIKDAIMAAKGEKIPAESMARFDKILPVLEGQINQANEISAEEIEKENKMDHVAFQIDNMIDAFGGKKNVRSTLNEMFHSYLWDSEGKDPKDLAMTHELVTELQGFFE